jgi:hypothetical protein
MILDGGVCEVGVESTILNLSGDRPEILRHGAVTREMLEAVLGVPVPDAGSNAPRASGRLQSTQIVLGRTGVGQSATSGQGHGLDLNGHDNFL